MPSADGRPPAAVPPVICGLPYRSILLTVVNWQIDPVTTDPRGLTIRTATVADAAGVAAVMNAVIADGAWTLFDRPFSVEEERRFIGSLGPRSALRIAEADGEIVGVQSLDLHTPMAASMSHVATMGTWLRADARGRGIGFALAEESLQFATAAGYTKILIQVLAGNGRALRFYRRLGFQTVGVARRHVRLGGVFHDEVLLEVELTQVASARRAYRRL